ncbi:MAG: hypothetical protein Q7R35_00860 [Elusimicrobiota bacterium]|nr:hypothetical protein [Elusimicrobiota bacterium]
MSIEEKVNISLNQNLWGLFIALAALGIPEKYDLRMLSSFSSFLALIFSMSVIITTIAYTINYWKHKVPNADKP